MEMNILRLYKPSKSFEFFIGNSLYCRAKYDEIQQDENSKFVIIHYYREFFNNKWNTQTYKLTIPIENLIVDELNHNSCEENYYIKGVV